MNSIFWQRASLVLSCTAATVLSSAMSVRAEITKSTDAVTIAAKSSQMAQSVAPPDSNDSSLTSVSKIDRVAVDAKKTAPQAATKPPINLQLAKSADAGKVEQAKTDEKPIAEPTAQSTATPVEQNDSGQGAGGLENTSSSSAKGVNNQPVFGKFITSAAALQSEPANSSEPQLAPEPEDSKKVAQSNVSASQYKPSRVYIGVGYSSVGGGGFAVLGKIGITKNISFRPIAAFIDHLESA